MAFVGVRRRPALPLAAVAGLSTTCLCVASCSFFVMGSAKGWSEMELTVLASAYLAASDDTLKGTDQKGDEFFLQCGHFS